jgi:hypothetical protein
MDFPPAIVEKDFWVCWTLKRLFGHPEFGKDLIFKGGTSLSKVYDVIERFSEDIDISISRKLLGFTGERDPERADLSNKKRQGLLDEMSGTCSEYVRSALKEKLEGDFSEVIREGGGEWSLNVDERDPDNQTLLFYYPSDEERLHYIHPFVRIELGCRSDTWPTEETAVRAYCAERFPEAFEDEICPVKVLTVVRTFWEKATILHQEYHRPMEKSLPARHSRHYYDMAMLARSEHKDTALCDRELLKRVVEHKMAFFRCGWAKYDLAVPGSFRLSPASERLSDLKADYGAMGVMFFGDIPGFDEVLALIGELEGEINGSRSKQGRS